MTERDVSDITLGHSSFLIPHPLRHQHPIDNMYNAVGRLNIRDYHVGNRCIAVTFYGKRTVCESAESQRCAAQGTHISSVHFRCKFSTVGYHMVEQYRCYHVYAGL